MAHSYATYADVLKQQEGDGSITANIIEMLKPSCHLINDAYVDECNNKTSNITPIRTSIPEPDFRTFYRGASSSKSTVRQVVDTCGQLTDYSDVDKSLCDIQKNPGQFRLNESQAHWQGFHSKIMKTLLYGNLKTDVLGFDGLATRYGKKSSTANSVGNQIVDAGATGATECTSVYAVTFGDKHTKLIYPENTKAGFVHKDLGEVTAEDTNGKFFQAYRDYFEWWVGLSIGNYKSSARLANISTTSLRAGNVDIENLLLDLYYKINDDREGGETFFYANPEVCKALHKKAIAKTNMNLTLEQVGGKPIVRFIDVTIRSTKEIKVDESVVS